jgi:chromosome segregation ATPase
MDERLNFSSYSGTNLNDIIKNQENIINQLKRTIQVYEKNTEDQIRKLANHDSLVIEYNSLMKNYAELENELSLSKNENIQIKNIINKKNQTISEYQRLFEDSKTKFEMFEQMNNSLKLKIKELESKLASMPNIVQNNSDLNLKLNEYDNRIKLLREEYNRKEDLFKKKLNDQEKMTKMNSRTYEEDIIELKNEIKNLKNQNDALKRKNDDFISNQKMSENDHNMKIKNKDKEIEKLTKVISELKSNINNNLLNNKSEIINNKNIIEKLKIENDNLSKGLDERDQQINDLNMALNDADNAIKQSEAEINTRENTINSLLQEKESLLKQLNDKQIDFTEYQNSSQQEIDILHNKLEMLEKEKNMLISDNENHKNEINQLHDDINQYLNDDKIHFEECKEADKKYNDLANAYKIKERDYSAAMAQLNVLNNNLRVELELIKSKYEKKIQILTLNNNELNARVKNLINTLIGLKDYALSIERNMNDVSMMRQQGNNCSMFVKNNCSSFLNDDNNINCDNNNVGFENNQYQNSRELLNDMKNMIQQIDVRINNEMDCNQAY